jgi:hypothetical protein
MNCERVILNCDPKLVECKATTIAYTQLSLVQL